MSLSHTSRIPGPLVLELDAGPGCCKDVLGVRGARSPPHPAGPGAEWAAASRGECCSRCHPQRPATRPASGSRRSRACRRPSRPCGRPSAGSSSMSRSQAWSTRWPSGQPRLQRDQGPVARARCSRTANAVSVHSVALVCASPKEQVERSGLWQGPAGGALGPTTGRVGIIHPTVCSWQPQPHLGAQLKAETVAWAQ